MDNSIKKIGIMTGGGDCPGLNAVIRAVTTTAINKYGLEVVGIKNGYRGLYLGASQMIPLTLDSVEGIIGKGGTILYTARCEEFTTAEGQQRGAEICKKNGHLSKKTVLG